jgi:hypothetical protein
VLAGEAATTFMGDTLESIDCTRGSAEADSTRAELPAVTLSHEKRGDEVDTFGLKVTLRVDPFPLRCDSGALGVPMAESEAERR